MAIAPIASERRTCTRCVMDASAGAISFDERGHCNYCTTYERLLERNNSRNMRDGPERLGRLVQKIKAGRERCEYDCIVGVSGGVDSSYTLLLAVELGLRPLAVHLDNGWNSELAAHNIASLVSALGVDLYTHVIDWEENRDLQRSFFKAHVVDIELLMDNAMLALNYQQAAQHGVRYILAGTNLATEGLTMPAGWAHYKRDARNIRAIQQRFGTKPIETHPILSTLQHAKYELIKGIRWTSFLNYVEYHKNTALDRLKAEVGYKPYPYKHYESVFTRFYQAHILPRKFGIDKRRVHLSTLILSGQTSRDDALRALDESPYGDANQEEQDKIYVMKKLGFSDDEFRTYISAPAIPHRVYGSEVPLYRVLSALNRWIVKRSSA